MTSHSYALDSQPLGFLKGYPLYLATVLVALHVLSMLVGVIGGESFPGALSFAPGVFGWDQLWRWVTYVLVNQPSLWFVIEMYFLYRFGIEIEKVFGRRVLAQVYAGLVLLPPFLATLVYALSGGGGIVLAGTGLSHICLFVAFCLLYPSGLMFAGVPWLTLAVGASVFVGIQVLSDLAARNGLRVVLLLANLGLTYAILRRAGLTSRFGGAWDAFRGAMPMKRSEVAGGVAVAPRAKVRRGESRPYEAKIKPKVDLAPERRAVEEIDGILDKIAKSGMGSLTDAERARLQRASSKLKESS